MDLVFHNSALVSSCLEVASGFLFLDKAGSHGTEREGRGSLWVAAELWEPEAGMEGPRSTSPGQVSSVEAGGGTCRGVAVRSCGCSRLGGPAGSEEGRNLALQTREMEKGGEKK